MHGLNSGSWVFPRIHYSYNSPSRSAYPWYIVHKKRTHPETKCSLTTAQPDGGQALTKERGHCCGVTDPQTAASCLPHQCFHVHSCQVLSRSVYPLLLKPSSPSLIGNILLYYGFLFLGSKVTPTRSAAHHTHMLLRCWASPPTACVQPFRAGQPSSERGIGGHLRSGGYVQCVPGLASSPCPGHPTAQIGTP